MRFNHFNEQETIISMAGRSPGAVLAMCTMYNAAINGLGGHAQWPWEMIKICDELEIYGSRLYMLWNDCLGRSTDGMAKLAKAYRAGKISALDIRKHIQGDGGRGLPFGKLEGDGGA